jgi:hypothetical protein
MLVIPYIYIPFKKNTQILLIRSSYFRFCSTKKIQRSSFNECQEVGVVIQDRGREVDRHPSQCAVDVDGLTKNPWDFHGISMVNHG